ncbi:GNAT family N-acetyltransferase [Neptuniibacter sp.]|uniref:GNAT family N-acetyltransferase n=1 Tax=Neptuniibacter sp. TaxID=1962643 RepID=UPI003B5B21C3
MKIENANRKDAAQLAYLINLAGEGIPEYLWQGMIEDTESPLEVGAKRAAREEGGFSYRNAKVIRKGNKVAGMIISYPLDDPYETGDLSEYPDVVRPLIELEAQAPGSWYINALATSEQFRGLGIASRLLQDAEQQAHAQGVSNMSIIVASKNPSAKKLYLNQGYQLQTSRPVVEYPNCIHGGNWELLIKNLT